MTDKIRAWVLSDLHVDVLPEKYGFRLPKPRPDHDVVVIAGDICENAVKAVKWIAHNALNRKPVIYVRGNHDSYRQAIDDNLEQALAETAKYENIHLLENSHVDIDGVRFLGGTLWTDYLLYGEQYRVPGYMHAGNSMNDHRLIRVARNGYSRFRTNEAYLEHVQTRDYIAAMLDQPFDGPRIVVTHHCPSIKSIDPRYEGDLLNVAYASNLDHLVDKADLWVHGHVHSQHDYRLGDGRVVCNPRGYAGYGEKSGFDPALVIEIPRVSHRKVEDDAA